MIGPRVRLFRWRKSDRSAFFDKFNPTDYVSNFRNIVSQQSPVPLIETVKPFWRSRF